MIAPAASEAMIVRAHQHVRLALEQDVRGIGRGPLVHERPSVRQGHHVPGLGEGVRSVFEQALRLGKRPSSSASSRFSRDTHEA